MLKNLFGLGITCSVAMVALSSCEHQDFTNENEDVLRVEVGYISPEMAKVRDYVPPMAVMAHRGSTFWAPEETESAWRWAREMGVDYLESDLQCSKDGVVIANHDDNLKRTTDVENVFGEYVPSTRRDFYIRHGLTPAEADAQVAKDKANFRPYYINQYMYEELLKLDAGTWFNQTSDEQARAGFSREHQYVSALEDQIRYAEGKRLKRDANGERIYKVSGTWNPDKPLDCIKYEFEYEADPADTGNRPGVYIEFKESYLNPSDFEQRVYNTLDRLGWNIMTKPAVDGNQWYKNGKVNVANTNGKVVLQSFSLQSLQRTAEVFQGQLPMCFLLWEGTSATDLKYNTPSGYASFINLALEYKAHIIGPSIEGAPNNYPEMDAPWQAYLIKKAGLLNHPYSFDSYAQMGKYFGQYNWGIETQYFEMLNVANTIVDAYKQLPLVAKPSAYSPSKLAICGDAAFTNRSEMTLKYFIDHGLRMADAPQTVPDAVETLERLGYEK